MNAVSIKSRKFAVRIINMCKYLREEKSEYILTKQIIRSGTSIGANLAEAECAESKKDFAHKMYIAFKESNETLYWLELLKETNYLNQQEFDSLYQDCLEIKKLLSSITRTIKEHESGKHTTPNS